MPNSLIGGQRFSCLVIANYFSYAVIPGNGQIVVRRENTKQSLFNARMRNLAKPREERFQVEPTSQSPSGPCYCPKCRNEDAAEDTAEEQEGRKEDWLGRRGKISGAKYIIVIRTNSTLSQRWKGRRELSTGRAGELWILTELFHLLRFLMAKLPNIWWNLFPFDSTASPSCRDKQWCQETRLKQKLHDSYRCVGLEFVCPPPPSDFYYFK